MTPIATSRVPAPASFSAAAVGIVIFAVAIIGALWLAIEGLIDRESQARVFDAIRENANIARAFEEHSIRTLEYIDEILLRLRRSYEADPENFDVARECEGLRFNPEIIRNVVITDKAGLSVQGCPPVPRLSLADREHVRVHLEGTEDTLFIGKPLIARINGQWSIVISRRLVASDGSLAGVILLAVNPFYFSGFYKDLDLGSGALLSLVGLDGIIRSRIASGTEDVGQDISGSELFRQFARAASGTYVSEAVTDGVRRIFAYRKVRGHALISTVGTSYNEAMAPVLDRARTYRTAATLASALIAAFAATLAIVSTRQKRSAVRLGALVGRRTAELSRSEAVFRALAELASVGIFRTGADGKTFYVNDRYCEIVGLPRQAALGDGWAENIHPDDRERVIAEWMRSAAAQEPAISEYRFLHPDGQVRWVIGEARPAGPPGSEAAGYIGTIVDITERKLSELRLRRSEAWLNDLVELAPDAIVMVDGDGLIALANREAEKIFGCRRADILAQPIGMFLPGLAESARGPSSAAGEGVRAMKSTAKRKDGSKFPVSVSLGEIESGDGKMATIIIRDVTVIESYERELVDARGNLTDAIESMNHTVMLYDKKDRIVLFSSSIFDQYPGLGDSIKVGATFEDVMRKAVERNLVVIPSGQLPEDFIAERIAQHRRADGVPITRLLPDGRVLRISELPARNGGILTIGMDVTEQSKVEQALRESQKMEAIGQLTGGIAHDFNNHLTVVIGNLEMLKEFTTGDPRQARHIEAALHGASRSAELTQGLLAFARRQPLSPKISDVGACIRDSVALLERTIREDIEVRFSRDSGIWPVLVDEAQLGASIVNLANNACDAMPGGGVLSISVRNVELTAEGLGEGGNPNPGAYVEIEVADTGTGMPGEVLERAFEPFFTTKEIGKGTGLGLSMVHGFVKQTGGFIDLRSEVGRGTTVLIRLPRAAGMYEKTASIASGLGPSPAGEETVLVVEDNPGVRQTVAAQIASLGYRVLEAGNGREALSILDRDGLSIDLLFSDIVMPGGVDGYALARAATERRPGIGILLTSGFPRRTQEDSVEHGNFRRLLSKPYRHADLAAAIRAVLDSVRNLDRA